MFPTYDFTGLAHGIQATFFQGLMWLLVGAVAFSCGRLLLTAVLTPVFGWAGANMLVSVLMLTAALALAAYAFGPGQHVLAAKIMHGAGPVSQLMAPIAEIERILR